MKKFLLVLLFATVSGVLAMEEEINQHALTDDDLADGAVYTVSDFIENPQTKQISFVKKRPLSFTLSRKDREGSVYQTKPDERGKVLEVFYTSEGKLEGFETAWVQDNVVQEDLSVKKNDKQSFDESNKYYDNDRSHKMRSILSYFKKHKIEICLFGSFVSIFLYAIARRGVNNQKLAVSGGSK